MSNATQQNFGAAQRERDRRLKAMLEGGAPIGSLAITGEPGWDAFFGSLHDKEDAARAAGMGFRADLGGIGRFGEPVSGAPNVRANIAGNIGLGQLTDANAVRQLAMKRQAEAGVDAAIGDMRGSYDEQVAQSIGQPPPRDHMLDIEEGAGGEPVGYKLRPAVPETDRERILASLPPAARPQFQKLYADQDLAVRKQAETERAAKANEAIASASTLSDDAIDQNARQYLQTGVMPVLGMKDPGNRAKILNRAAELDAGGNVAANKAGYKADSGSLTALQKQRDAVGAFEGTALKNLDVFIDAAKKIPDTGSPALNKPLRLIDEKALGSADMAAFNAARRTVIPEFAKILANPGLSGQLSDSARHEVEQVMSGDATLPQILAVANTLKTDANNRRTEFDRQIDEIKGRIAKPGGGGKPAAGGSTDYRKKYDY